MYRPWLLSIGRLLVVVLFALARGSLESAEQKKVIVDFEDFGTWRLKENVGIKPGIWWPVFLGLSGSDHAKYRDDYVGELRFAFDPESKSSFSVGFERAKMALTSGFLSGIELDADARDLPVSLRFVIQDSSNRQFRTSSIPLRGKGWNHYRLDLNANTMPGFDNCKFPARLKRIVLESSAACEGSVFMDDIVLAGRFTKRDQITLAPIYEGIYYPPGKDVTLRYRLRNAHPNELASNVHLEVKDFSGKRIQSKDSIISLPPSGSAVVSFELGKLSIGAYEVVLSARAGEFHSELQDHFGVFTPNAGRLNHHPMWFGVGDQTSWQGETENVRHLEWMKLLGADINRLQLFSNRFKPGEELLGNEGWRKLIQAHADNGVDVLLLLSDTPAWTQSQPDYRSMPELYPAYEEYVKRLGVLLKEFSNVKYLEFWNEPDVDFFHGTLSDYIEMLRHFSNGFKETHPHLPILSGGVTVVHPKEKPGFSKGMYQDAAGLYDIAAYHSHGPLANNEQHQKRVESWLNEVGLNKRFANTETGERSLYDAEGRRRQAITLVKKIVYSKSIPNFELYIWFTLQDYWDMDPEADDSFGLVTSDNRAKPSFVAYNALINKFANTVPESTELSSDKLSIYKFRKDDGRYIYAGWPSASKKGGILWLKTAQAIEVSDMFGAARNHAPLGSVVPISFADEPLYISGKGPGEEILLCAPQEEFLRVNTEVNYTGDRSVSVPVFFRNPTNKSLEGVLIFNDDAGQAVAKRPFTVEAGKEFQWPAHIPIGPSETYDERLFQLNLEFSDRELPTFSFPVQLIRTYPIQKVSQLGDNPANWPSVETVPVITLNRPDQIVELTYDPTIPAWKDPSDLSAKAAIVHDDRGIRFHIEVTDDVSGSVQRKEQLWRGDDVQVAFAGSNEKEFAILDLGLTAEGPTVWCSQHRNSSLRGLWNVPCKITRKGAVTTYDAYLPFEQLDISLNATPRTIRFTFLVNEDDKRGRVRWIQWKDGIGKNRSLEMLGYGALE